MSEERKPTSIFCIGMAGSGKTTFMQRLNSYLHSENESPYVINLDPAVHSIPYSPNIDIRDSIKYKKVMEQYNLGPNGAIVTSLNLFSTKIDQVLALLKKRSFPHCIIDTPGQIECFVWSASGSIITEAFATEYPTVIAYIIDTPKCSNPVTFMSNMLYACSILYKTKLPMVVVFNKTDIKNADEVKSWMNDFEAFQSALMSAEVGEEYMGSLVNSMSLVLEEFYKELSCVGVSSWTGDGMKEFMESIEKKRDEFEEYEKERDVVVNERKEAESKKQEKSLNKLMDDMNINEKADVNEGVDVVSDLEDEEIEKELENDDKRGYENGLIDLDGEREYTFQEDRLDELQQATDIQQRYQKAFEDTAKTASTQVAEDIAKYIRRS